MEKRGVNFTDMSVCEISRWAYPLTRYTKKGGSQAMTSQMTFTVNPEAVGSFHDDGVVILHGGNGRLFTSNVTGARIWRAIEQQLPFETIANEISTAYHIARTTAREHTLSFLTALEQHALIKIEVAS